MPTTNGYRATYHGARGAKAIDVYADTLLGAKIKAVAAFKAPRSKEHMVSVMLCEKDVPIDGEGRPIGPGTPVVHTPDF